MNQGLGQGLGGGILCGLCPASGIAPLSSLDFTRPAQQAFPATDTGFASLAGDALALPDSIWPMNELSGNLIDSLGNENLIQNGATALQGQKAVGFHNGVDFVSKRALEFTAISSRFEASDNTVYDNTTGSFAHVFMFRTKRSSDNQYIMRKRDGEGQYLRVHTSGALWFFLVGDTDNELVQVAGNHSDGAWHIGICGWHAGDSRSHLRTDQGSTVSPVSVLGNFTNGDKFTLGDTAIDLQLAYGATLSGEAAEALLELGDTAIANIWKHGTDPTGILYTHDRDTLISCQLDGSNHVGHFANEAIAIGYSPEFTGASKLGLCVNDAVQNLITSSEDLFPWADKASTAFNGNFKDSPDGFRSADKIRATADNAYHGNVLATAALTEYTLSTYISNADTGEVSGRLIMYDLTNGAEVAAQAFTTSSAWERVSLTATTAAGQISTGFRVEIDTNTDALCVWGAQCELGAYMTTYVRSISGVATTSERTYFRANFLMPSARCEVKSVSCKTAVRTNVAIWNALSIVGNQNRRRILSNPSLNTGQIYNALGATEDTYNIAHGSTLSEEVIRMLWDSDPSGVDGGGREMVLVYQGVRYDGSLSPWETPVGGADVFVLDVGSVAGGFVQPGFYQSITSYDDLSEALP